MDETLLLFTIIVSIILFAPFFFGRIKLPLISSLIIAGVIVGPSGFELIELTDTIEVLGILGLLYLLFLLGEKVYLPFFRSQ